MQSFKKKKNFESQSDILLCHPLDFIIKNLN